MKRRQFLRIATGVAALPAVAWAQAYPTRPPRIIVGFPPGGTAKWRIRMTILKGMGSVITFILAASTIAWGDATETIDPKSAVEFVLSTCLPAMDDVANAEVMARRNNWFHLPTTAYESKYTTPHLRWRADGYMLVTWSWKETNLPHCFVGLRPYKKVNRDGFFDAISASLELKLISERTLPSGFRQETYEIIGERPLKLMFSSSNNDGIVSAVSIYRENGVPR